MTQDMFKFKSVQMAKEVTLAGDFVFTSAKKAMQLTTVHNEFDINAILYNGSVGIERLQKIYLYLCLDNPFEEHKDLITHNHCELEKKVAKESSSNLYENGMSLISKFNVYYNQHRYGNYDPIPKKETIIDLFISFLKKVNGKVDFYEPITHYELEPFKRFYINTLGKTANHYYELIRDKANEIGVFAYELDPYSNSTRVFWTDGSLYEEMLLEQQAVKELFLYFYKNKPQEGVFRLLNEMESLEFEDSSVNDFLSELSDRKTNHELTDWVSEMYCNIEDEKELRHRKELVSLIGNPGVDYYLDEEDND